MSSMATLPNGKMITTPFNEETRKAICETTMSNVFVRVSEPKFSMAIIFVIDVGMQPNELACNIAKQNPEFNLNEDNIN